MGQTPLTKEYFDSVIKGQNGRFDGMGRRFDSMDRRFEGLEATITANTKDIIGHFNKSQGFQNERMGEMDRKLDVLVEDVSKVKLAVVDLLATDKHLHNLVRELRAQGLQLDESKIFVV